jgi:Asp-tRNA(Asn)/Glu-tRNA(Gln) amidotransferase A subunit family amidase
MCTEALHTHRGLGLWPARADEYTPRVRERLELAETFSDADVLEARAELDRMRVAMDGVWAEYDLVESPIASAGPPRFDAGIDPRDLAARWVVLQDLLGLPCLARPDGTQLTGPRGADAAVLAAGVIAP